MAQIQAKKLFDICPDAGKVVPRGAAIKVIRERYCSKITVAGKCDVQCEKTCGNTIRTIFSRMNSADDKSKPVGLLVWLARTQAANLIEEITEKEKAQPKGVTDGWGVTKKPETRRVVSLEDILNEG